MNEENEDMLLKIPLLDNGFALIEHCGVDQAHKLLGIMTYPSGWCEAAIDSMKERSQG